MSTLKVSPIGRVYPLRPDTPDRRDRRMRLTPAALNKVMGTPRMDFLDVLGPVKDQGDLGACTGFANGGLREFLYRRYYSYEKDRSVAPADFIVSPLNLYWNERMLEGDIYDDGGAMMRTGMRVMNRFGVCLESEDPYQPANFTLPPTEEQRAQAELYRGGSYHSLQSIDTWKSCLASGFIHTFALDVYESFESDELATSGEMPVPDFNREKLLGGHALLNFGYDDDHANPDDSRGAFHVRNSWGVRWGQQGSFWMSYGIVIAGIAYDAWMMHLGPGWIAPRTR